MKRMRAHCRLLVAVALLLCTVACTSTPSGPIHLEESSYEPVSHESGHAPWGTLAVRFVRDIRPGWEVGFHNYLNESYYSDELFELPVPVTLKRLILKEMKSAGVFEPEQEQAKSKYVAEFTLRHFFIRTDRSIFDLIPILPTTTVEAVIDFDVRLVDQDGRLFLNKRYNSRDEEREELNDSLRGSGVDRLLTILSVFMNELAADMDLGVSEFWKELGMPVQ